MTWWKGIQEFNFKSSVQSNGRCVSTYMEKYLLRTDAATFPTPGEISAAAGIVRGSPYPVDLNATCYDVDIGPGPVMTRPPFLAFTVTALWATNAAVPKEDDDDPTTSWVEWSIEPNFQSRYIIKDRHGNLITNTLGQPYSGGIPVDVKLGVVTAERDRLALGYNVNDVIKYSGRWNKTEFLGGPAGTVQVVIKSKKRREGGFYFWHETFTFTYDPQGIQPKVLNAGLFQRHPSDIGVSPYRLKRITNGDLGDVTSPHTEVQEEEPLDADGILIDPSARPTGCIFNTVDYYLDHEFADFDLGSPED